MGRFHLLNFKQYCSEELTTFHSYAQIFACSGFASWLEPLAASRAFLDLSFFPHPHFYFLRFPWCAHEEDRVGSPTSQLSPLYSGGKAVPPSSSAFPPALSPLLSPHPHPPAQCKPAHPGGDRETLHQGWIQVFSSCRTTTTLFHQQVALFSTFRQLRCSKGSPAHQRIINSLGSAIALIMTFQYMIVHTSLYMIFPTAYTVGHDYNFLWFLPSLSFPCSRCVQFVLHIGRQNHLVVMNLGS